MCVSIIIESVVVGYVYTYRAISRAYLPAVVYTITELLVIKRYSK